MTKLKKIYLAVPYSGMEESSFDQVSVATARILNRGEHNVFSPITHSHPLAKSGLPGNWEYWKAVDYQFIDWADEVWVLVPKEGMKYVSNSTGVQAEMNYAQSKKMVVRFIEMNNEGKLQNYQLTIED